MKHGQDAIVIGGGIMGTMTALFLARSSGMSVTLLERRNVGAGSTGKSGAILRQHYSHPVTVGMARSSLGYYAALHERTAAGIDFRRPGLLLIAEKNAAEGLARNLAVQRAAGVIVESLDANELRAHDADVVVTDDEIGAFEPEAACVDPMATVLAVAEEAIASGVRFVPDAEVRAILSKSGRVVGVKLKDGAEMSADLVVAATGPWSRPLLEAAGFPLPLTVVSPGQAWLGRSATRKTPSPLLLDVAHGIYCRPEGPGWTRIGELSIENDPVIEDPNTYDEGIDDGFIQRVRGSLSARVRSLRTAPSLGGCRALYTTTPDSQAIIDTCPNVSGLWVATGFSGHGFKLAPSVAQLLTDRILARPVDPKTVAYFEAARFHHAAPPTSTYRYGILG